MAAFPRRSLPDWARVVGRTLAIGAAVTVLVSPLSAQTPTQNPTTANQTPQQDPQGPPTQTPTQELPPAKPPETQTSTPSPFDVAPPSRPTRPYRGLFGAPQVAKEPRLTLEASAGFGINGNPVTDAQSASSAAGTAGGSGAANGTLNVIYSWNRPTIGVDLSNAFYVDYYRQYRDHNMLPRDIANGAVYFVPKPSTRVTISETFKNLPEFALSDLHGTEFGEVVPAVQDIGLTVDRYTRWGTSVDMSQNISKRSRANFSAGYAHGMISSRAWTILTLEGGISYSITKDLSAGIGYQYGGQRDESAGATGERESHPRITGGLDYHHALSFSRRTTLSFSTGFAGTQDRTRDPAAAATGGVESQTNYHVVGGVVLGREFGRTWNASLAYSHNVRYVEALNEPVFSDALAGVVGGSLSRRVEVKAMFSGSTGHLGSTGSKGFDTYFGSVQASVGLTRNLAFGGDYLYSRLRSLPPELRGEAADNLADRLSQQSARVYLKFWAPLLTSPRRP